MITAVQVAMDCVDPHPLCRFWADVMGFEVVYGDDDIRSLIAAGHATDDDTAEFEGHLVWRTGAACTDPNGVLPRMYFQQVADVKTVKDRVHLDLRTGEGERDAQVERIVGLGARVLWEASQGPHSWVTLADPEGNEFCVS